MLWLWLCGREGGCVAGERRSEVREDWGRTEETEETEETERWDWALSNREGDVCREGT